MRFALIPTVDFGLTRWEIHKPECDDVTRSLHSGSFVAIVSAESPEILSESELEQQGAKIESFKIMPAALIIV
jgi:hypothetical protein